MSRDWFGCTAHEISDALRSGAVTAREVAQSCLDRIDAVDGRVQAYVEVWRDEALRQADAADARIQAGTAGPLTGVPVSLKDVLCTQTGATTCCSRILEGYRSPFDATVVRRLQEAGAVFLGKVNMDEFAMGSTTENSARQVTRNPWDLERVPGGSSGGSAASVAADETAISIGSDTGGSIRQPAAFCGCVGMKPTYGRVSRYGLVAFASSLDQIGPLAKDVRDCATTLNVICGRDPHDSTSADVPVPDFTEALTGDVGDLRIGLPRECFTEDLSDVVRGPVIQAARTLEDRGATLVDVDLPLLRYAVATYYIICTAEASANLARFDGVRYGYRDPDAKNVQDMYVLSKSRGFGPEVQRRIVLGTYVLSSGYYDAYYLKAQRVRRLIRDDYARAFASCDAILMPVTPSPAYRLGEMLDDPLQMYLADIYTIGVNLAGLPAISVPCGKSSAGLPIGMQLVGKAFDEATILRAAHAYELHAGIALGRPALAG